MSYNRCMKRDELDSWRNATSETAPFTLWVHAVIGHVGCQVIDTKQHRARLQLWYRSGEPVWMAADSLRAFIDGSRRAEREDRDARVIHRAYLAASDYTEQ